MADFGIHLCISQERVDRPSQKYDTKRTREIKAVTKKRNDEQRITGIRINVLRPHLYRAGVAG
jgi:hypothetical protein